MANKGLGRGLGALIGGSALASPQPQEDKGERIQALAISRVVPSPFQPRKVFREEQLDELVQSIRERGIIQPLIVRQVGDKFELIAGERRWRAAQRLGLTQVPAIVRSASDREVLELALIENLQRADLNPVEEAEGYALLMHQFKLTQEQVAERVGKSRVAVANAVRLLSLHEGVRRYLALGQLSVGHAKVILGLALEEEQSLVADKVLKEGLTVRQTERVVDSLRPVSSINRGRKKIAPVSAATWTDLEKQLQRSLGTRVRLQGSANKGQIQIEFYSADELHRLLQVLGVAQA
jgi:ParB family transcriptional regulator, chromosome partitioning protein